MYGSTDTSIIRTLLKAAAILGAVIVGIIVLVYANHRYNLKHYGAPPVEVKTVTCVDVRSYNNNNKSMFEDNTSDKFIFEDDGGSRYQCNDLNSIIIGDKAELKIIGDKVFIINLGSSNIIVTLEQLGIIY